MCWYKGGDCEGKEEKKRGKISRAKEERKEKKKECAR